MNRNEFGKDLFSNIEIRKDVKKELLENCKKGRTTADFRFKHAGLLTALIVTAAFAGTGITAKAYYESVATRMEAMTDEEKDVYVHVLENTEGVKTSDGWSRNLSNGEIERVAELEQKYNSQNLFPEDKVETVEKLSDWDGESICFVEEDNTLHFPEGEMTDEQLLLFVDYTTKTDYVMNESKESEEDTFNPFAEVDPSAQGDFVERAKQEFAKLFDPADIAGWKTVVKEFTPSKDNPAYREHDNVYVYYKKNGGSDFSTRYVVCFRMFDGKLMAVAVDGLEHWSTLGSYTPEAANVMAIQDQEDIIAQVTDLYGYGTPEKTKYEFVDTWGDDGDIRQLYYKFYYGEDLVSITWDLSTHKISSIEFYKTADEFIPEE